MSHFNLHEIRKGKLILEALLKYGIMNRRTLQQVVPEIKDHRNFRRTLTNLCGRGLIVKRYDYINENRGVFYQLNQKSFIREVLATYLDTQAKMIEQKQLRYKELFHEQVLIKIAYHLNQNYPEAIVLKDHDLVGNDEARSIIIGLDEIDQLKPDLLFITKSKDLNRKVSVAIEFEKTMKSKIRMEEKLKFYTDQTIVDGVLYLYTNNRIDHNLHEIFMDKILNRSLRIRHYGKNFLLTCRLGDNVENSMRILFNRDMNYYSFQDWIKKLSTSSSENRRNEMFTDNPSKG